MRMRQSLADIERAFVEETAEDRERRQRLRERAVARSRRRRTDRVNQRGARRFAVVLAILLLTAIVVTIAMFQTLYYVLG
jgi:hypothetical protein